MKKSLLIWLLFLWSISLTWCFNIKDWPGMERNLDGGGEWFSIAEWYCADEWGELQAWEEGNDYQYVCFYADDESYCYLEDLYDGLCSRWEFYYFDDYDLYQYAEQVCLGNDGQLSTTDSGENICILSDDDFCYINDIIDGWCDLLYEDMIVCTEEYDPVCWVDWNTYSNRCFMEVAWTEEETELAEVVDGVCVFG